MHNFIYKIQKNSIPPPQSTRLKTIQESQKVELEILIGQGIILKNPTLPFFPSAPQMAQGNIFQIPKTQSLFFLLQFSKAIAISLTKEGFHPANTHQGKR